MKTKNIFKMLAFAMLMPAMMLTTACSSDNDVINTPEKTENTTGKGYEIPITINATRQDAATTRATYDESTKKLNFSTGDQLYVRGNHTTAGDFTGTLEWMGGITFSGTITTTNQYSGTAIDLLTSTSTTFVTAILLPKDYTTYNFLYFDIPPGMNINVVIPDYTKAFATSKATAVEQFSYEYASTYSNGFTLTPRSAILNFTITGLTANKKVEVNFQDYKYNNIPGEVTTDGSGTATFAIGIFLSNVDNLNGCSLNVDGNDITLVTSSTPLEPGHIYNITRSASGTPTPAAGQFSVSATKKVTFSSGNLQATWDGTSWNWHFAENQWDYIGNAEGNTKVTNTTPFVSEYSGTSTTVDLFGWVGASSEFTGAAQYGITSSENEEDYGNVYGEALKSDWGNTMGSGWRTLSKDEWFYLFNTRTVNGGTGSGKSYTLGQSVNSVQGVVLYPDGYTGELYTTAQSSNWATFESAGCVFLPAAGRRNANIVDTPGLLGFYWSSSSLTSDVHDNNVKYAHIVRIYPSFLDSGDASQSIRTQGFSVRLVRDVVQ